MARRRQLSPEEADLWRRAMRSTEPLPGARLPDVPAVSPVRAARSSSTKAATPPLPGPSPARKPAPTPPLSNGLDGATARRVRRGKQQIDGRIDLHGMRQHEAHDALVGFILKSVGRGRRCVLVITGKGGRARDAVDDAPFMRADQDSWSARGDGVLRRQVPLWLSQEPLRSQIFATRPAHPRDGGSGALYVFLRRG